MSSSIVYRLEIEGLRCIAVLAVIAFHINKSILPGGYLGVDVFFVISGYLITSIIVREIEEGTFSLTKFWERRIRRIFPVATFVLLVVSLVQIFLIFKPDLIQQSNQKISAIFSLANVYFWRYTGDYWGNASEDSPFLHYWSLSVEEQYYLLFPLLILALFTKGKKYLSIVLVILLIISSLAFVIGTVYYPVSAFYLLPTRIWQIGAGCLLAVLSNPIPSTNKPFGTLIGLILICVPYFLTFNTIGIGYESLIVVFGTCLVIYSGSNKMSQIILENKVVTFIGKISFSLYLWHWPIIVILKNIKAYNYISSTTLLIIIGGFALLILSLSSFYFIEKQFRKHKYGTSISLSFAAIVCFYFFIIEPLLLKSPYKSKFKTPSWYGIYYDLKPRGELTKEFMTISNSVHTTKREASLTSFKTSGIIRQRSSPNVKVLLSGDSHSIMWSKLVDDITNELDLTTSLWSMNGELGLIQLPPIEPARNYLTKKERYEYDSSRHSYIQKWHPHIVIVANRWDNIPEGSIIDYFNFLESNAEHVIIIESPPILQNIGNRSVYQYLSFLGIDDSVSAKSDNILWPTNLENVSITRKKLKMIIANRPKFVFLPTADLFIQDSMVIVARENEVFYLDDDHLTDEGTKLAASILKKSIQDIANVRQPQTISQK